MEHAIEKTIGKPKYMWEKTIQCLYNQIMQLLNATQKKPTIKSCNSKETNYNVDTLMNEQ